MTIKIACFSPRAYGAMGTPGTYKFIEEFAKCCDVRLFALPPSDSSVYLDKRVPLIPLNGRQVAKSLEPLLPIVRAFGPDIVYIFNQVQWPELAFLLRKHVAGAKIVLDFKTPLVGVSDEVKHNTQHRGEQAASLVDGVVAVNRSAVESWLPGYNQEITEYSLGVDFDVIDVPYDKRAILRPTQFVYVSSLHPVRRSETMVRGFAQFLASRNHGAECTKLDIFGDGPAKNSLIRQVEALRISANVSFRGVVPQKDLFKLLRNYDAGIAWVPRELFDNSPSLKALEYMGAGLPVLATSTNAHRRLRDAGFDVHLFQDDAQGVADALVHITQEGFSLDQVRRNLGLVGRHKYEDLVQDRILPLLQSLAPHRRTSVPRSFEAPHNAPIEECIGIEATGRDNTTLEDASSAVLRLGFVCRGFIGLEEGADRAVVDLANEMARRGHCVYLAYSAGLPKEMITDKNVIRLPFEDPDVLVQLFGGAVLDVLAPLTADVATRHKLMALAHDRQVPVIFHEDMDSFGFGLERPRNEMAGRGRLLWQQMLVRSFARYVGVHGSTSSEVRFPSCNVQRISLPIPIDGGLACSEAEHESGQERRVLCVVDPSARAKVHSLIEVFRQAMVSCPDWYLTVFCVDPGEDGVVRVDTHRHETGEGMVDQVSVVSTQADYWSLLAVVDLVVLVDARSSVLADALNLLAGGVPLIVTDSSPLAGYIVHDDHNGVVVDNSADNEELISAMTRLMFDDELRERLGAQARRDSQTLAVAEVFDRWESALREAAVYSGDADRLLNEQYPDDPELALHVRRMRASVFGN